ncbi:glycosyltransferase family protein [Aquipuribacter sp. MA13-6]|uniref:glycosyltransferase family protein n=1 Tax=unclassified Aquipuribacter TaxID=2635084 RepID=UPI003EECC85B
MTSGHDVADARLHRVVAAAVEVGLRVEVLGLGDVADAPAGTTARTWRRRGPVGRALLAAWLPWTADGDVLLCPDPDSLLGGRLATLLRRRRLVADVHEDYAALLRDRAWARGPALLVARLLVRVAGAVAARADLTVVADDHVPPAAPACRRRLVVRNMPDADLMRRARTAATAEEAGRTAEERVLAVYVGDVRRSRGLLTMVEAVAAAPGWELDLVGPVSAPDRAWVQERLRSPDVAGRVRLHGRLTPERAWQVAARAQVGVALLEQTPAFTDAVPTKVYEYAAAGLAVLASPLPRVAALLDSSGGGELATTAEEAAAVLRGWSTEPSRLLARRRAATSWGDTILGEASPYRVLAEALDALARTGRRHPNR